MGERNLFSTAAAQLARVLCTRGEHDEADRFAVRPPRSPATTRSTRSCRGRAGADRAARGDSEAPSGAPSARLPVFGSPIAWSSPRTRTARRPRRCWRRRPRRGRRRGFARRAAPVRAQANVVAAAPDAPGARDAARSLTPQTISSNARAITRTLATRSARPPPTARGVTAAGRAARPAPACARDRAPRGRAACGTPPAGGPSRDQLVDELGRGGIALEHPRCSRAAPPGGSGGSSSTALRRGRDRRRRRPRHIVARSAPEQLQVVESHSSWSGSSSLWVARYSARAAHTGSAVLLPARAAPPPSTARFARTTNGSRTGTRGTARQGAGGSRPGARAEQFRQPSSIFARSLAPSPTSTLTRGASVHHQRRPGLDRHSFFLEDGVQLGQESSSSSSERPASVLTMRSGIPSRLIPFSFASATGYLPELRSQAGVPRDRVDELRERTRPSEYELPRRSRHR